MSLEHSNSNPKCLGDQRMAPRFFMDVLWFIENRLISYSLLLSQLNIDLHFLTHKLSQHLLFFFSLETPIYRMQNIAKPRVSSHHAREHHSQGHGINILRFKHMITLVLASRRGSHEKHDISFIWKCEGTWDLAMFCNIYLEPILNHFKQILLLGDKTKIPRVSIYMKTMNWKRTFIYLFGRDQKRCFLFRPNVCNFFKIHPS